VSSASSTLARAPSNPNPSNTALAGDQLQALVDSVVDLAGPIAVRFLYGAGVRDAKTLTNVLFWALHPTMAGKKIRKGQTALARDWIRIRDSLVLPGIRLASSPGVAERKPPPAGPLPLPYPSSTGAPPKEDTHPAPAAPTDKPAPPAAPSAPAPLRDTDLAQLIASLGNPAADEIANDLASLQAKSERLRQTKATIDREAEEIGAGRDELVNGIETLRQKVAKLDGSLDPRALSDLKRRINLAVNDISPYYYQSKNIDVLESKEMAKKLGTSTTVSTRTCNITSLSMALEGLGKSGDDYQGSKEAVQSAAEVFHTEVTAAKSTVSGGAGGTWDSIKGLRLPDFVQLAAIAEKLGGKAGSPQEVNAAAVTAWDAILSIGFLGQVAKKFSGVTAQPKPFEIDPTKVKTKKERTAEAYRLKGWAAKHRGAVEKLVDLRNRMEKAPEGKQREKLKQQYEAALKKLGGVVPGAGIEAEIPLESYKTAMKQQIGGELEAGSQIVVSLAGHYVRLQAIHEDHVMVDDPATAERANRKVLWDEARAMGYFNYRLVLNG